MVEVFKTNVTERYYAEKLVGEIHKHFVSYKANFDLDDCDKILRVKSVAEPIEVNVLVHLINRHGFDAEILPDEIPALSLLAS